MVGPGRPEGGGAGDDDAVGMRPALAGTLLVLLVLLVRATLLTALSLRLRPLPPGVGMLDSPELGDVDRDDSLLALVLLVLRLFPPETRINIQVKQLQQGITYTNETCTSFVPS